MRLAKSCKFRAALQSSPAYHAVHDHALLGYSWAANLIERLVSIYEGGSKPVYIGFEPEKGLTLAMSGNCLTVPLAAVLYQASALGSYLLPLVQAPDPRILLQVPRGMPKAAGYARLAASAPVCTSPPAILQVLCPAPRHLNQYLTAGASWCTNGRGVCQACAIRCPADQSACGHTPAHRCSHAPAAACRRRAEHRRPHPAPESHWPALPVPGTPAAPSPSGQGEHLY